MTLEVDSTSWREPQETDQIATKLIADAACTLDADVVLEVEGASSRSAVELVERR